MSEIVQVPGNNEDLSPERVADLLASSRAVWRDVTVVAETGSTNSDLLDRAANGEVREGAVIAAGEQTSGRGRLGRSWSSPSDTTLSFSVVLTPPVERAGFVPALTGIAVDRAIAGLTGLEATIKWPNDVMIDGLKVAGILAEAVSGAVVVGCGINVSIPDGELPVPTATSLSLHGAQVDRAELLVACLKELQAANSRWREAGYSTEASGLLAEYRKLCATVGQHVRVQLPDGSQIEGRATGIDETGHLVMEVDGGTRTLTAGDVVHLRPTK